MSSQHHQTHHTRPDYLRISKIQTKTSEMSNQLVDAMRWSSYHKKQKERIERNSGKNFNLMTHKRLPFYQHFIFWVPCDIVSKNMARPKSKLTERLICEYDESDESTDDELLGASDNVVRKFLFIFIFNKNCYVMSSSSILQYFLIWND